MKTIEFEIISSKNPQIHQNGYVEIPADAEEEVEWFYYDQNNFVIPRPFTNHDGIGLTATEEQEKELDDFLTQLQFEYVDFVDEVIVTSEEDENRTYKKGDLIIKINDGAKMECELKKPFNWRGDFVVELIPKFNGEKIDLVTYMQETFTEFDPWGVDDPNFAIEKGHIYFEMSKDYFEDGETERMDEVNEEARSIYARALTRHMGIYSRYGELMEQSMDDSYDNEWLFKMTLHKDDSDEELDAFLRDEGFIDELD